MWCWQNMGGGGWESVRLCKSLSSTQYPICKPCGMVTSFAGHECSQTELSTRLRSGKRQPWLWLRIARSLSGWRIPASTCYLSIRLFMGHTKRSDPIGTIVPDVQDLKGQDQYLDLDLVLCWKPMYQLHVLSLRGPSKEPLEFTCQSQGQAHIK